MNFKKLELLDLLLTISAFDQSGKMIAGLLSENISLGSKRKLQKLHKLAKIEYDQLVLHIQEIKESLKDDPGKMNKELDILINENVVLNADYLNISEIESISTSTNYNFELIEKFAR